VGSEGNALSAKENGIMAIRLPLPPGCLPTLWNDNKRYLECVMEIPGFYVTGDGGHVDEDGYLFIMGRMDDVINVAGHRLSTGHRDVAECAVLGANDQLKGQVSIGFAVLKSGVDRDPDEIIKELV